MAPYRERTKQKQSEPPVRVTVMRNPPSFIDGRRFLTGSPFRSPHFLVVTALGLGAILLDMLILYRSRHAAHRYSLVLAGALVAIQIIYQWWRTLRHYSRIRSLYTQKLTNEAAEGSPPDLALRAATGALADLLFYSYGIMLILLVLINLLMTTVVRGG